VTCWRPGPDGWRRLVRFQAHQAAVRRLRLVGGGLVASCGEDCALRLWDAATHTQVFEARHDNFVTDVLRRGNVILSSSYDGRILRHHV
jgi:WD40 repeat protein